MPVLLHLPVREAVQEELFFGPGANEKLLRRLGRGGRCFRTLPAGREQQGEKEGGGLGGRRSSDKLQNGMRGRNGERDLGSKMLNRTFQWSKGVR